MLCNGEVGDKGEERAGGITRKIITTSKNKRQCWNHLHEIFWLTGLDMHGHVYCKQTFDCKITFIVGQPLNHWTLSKSEKPLLSLLPSPIWPMPFNLPRLMHGTIEKSGHMQHYMASLQWAPFKPWLYGRLRASWFRPGIRGLTLC